MCRPGPDFSEREQVRKAEDRIRELQREVVAKEDQRAAMARHAEALEKKLVSAQEEARACKAGGRRCGAPWPRCPHHLHRAV